MAKAHIETPDGLSVKLDGTPEEISAVLKDIKMKAKDGPAPKGKATGKPARNVGKVTVTSLAEDLREEGYFKKPKTLGEVRSKLADLGHNYPITGLSGAM